MKIALILLLTLTGCSAIINLDTWRSALQKGLENYVHTGRKSDQLIEALVDVKFPFLFRQERTRIQREEMKPVICTFCDVGLGVLIAAHKIGFGKEILAAIVTQLCMWTRIDDPAVCREYINHSMDIWIYAVDNNPKATSNTFCAQFLQEFICPDPDRVDWSVNIPPPQSPVNNNHTYPKGKKEEQFKIVQITDVHYDPGYTVGSSSICNYPHCCQAGSVPSSPENAAGYWGNYGGCDTPTRTFVNVLNHVKEHHSDADFIYYTGDIIKHSDWVNSIEVNTEEIIWAFQKFKETFGSLPIYPILGNHDPHPENQFSVDGIKSDVGLSTQWIYDTVAELWRDWLPEETQSTVLRGGYYTVLVKPGLRVIALNSNVAYTNNFWLLYDDEDPNGQLQWMVDTLVEAEKNNEKVHVISHIPSSDMSCFFNWASEYRRIINRFSNVITAQFNGHTHYDETVVYFSTEEPSKAINIGFNGAGALTYGTVNPNYKTYEVDSNTFTVLNYDSWMFNVTEANENAPLPPRWYKEYDFKSAYNVTSLHPQGIAYLAERMAKTPALTQAYNRYKFRDVDQRIAAGCDSNCELANLCYMVTSMYGDNYHCKIYTDIFNNNRPPY